MVITNLYPFNVVTGHTLGSKDLERGRWKWWWGEDMGRVDCLITCTNFVTLKILTLAGVGWFPLPKEGSLSCDWHKGGRCEDSKIPNFCPSTA